MVEVSPWVQAEVGCESGLVARGDSTKGVLRSEDERVYPREGRWRNMRVSE